MAKKLPHLPQQDGALVLDKPQGPTSYGCLEQIKRGLGQRKIGHAGTLDPMARGVLVVLFGQATKLASYITDGDKIYRGRLRLGLETDTYDIEGTVEHEFSWEHVTREAVSQDIANWRELNEQEVPAYSAAKHKGKPLYALKRNGEQVPVKTKPVRIYDAQALDIALPEVQFRVSCSQGTYVRSLAHSLGKRLGCGATLTALVREYSHPFALEHAVALQTVLEEPGGLAENILPLERCLPHWPALTLDGRHAREVQNGARLLVRDVTADFSVHPGDRAQFVDASGRLLALVEAKWEGPVLVWSILRGFTPRKLH
ncbi:MAG: tRNA pseudouridine(55) synthase TruB [Desulfohalobium sp.]